jgi:hypothetical protein
MAVCTKTNDKAAPLRVLDDLDLSVLLRFRVLQHPL